MTDYYLAIAYDRDDIPRAWGRSQRATKAREQCAIALDDYIMDKVSRGRKISRDEFVIEVTLEVESEFASLTFSDLD